MENNTSSSFRFSEKIIEVFLFLCGIFSILITASIIIVLAVESFSFFQTISFSQFFFDLSWTPLFVNKHYGIWPLLIGTLMSSMVALMIAAPFGLMIAIYLSEFAGKSIRRWCKALIEILAGIPTIVYGFFALLFITPLLQKVIPDLSGFNALSPGIVMGIMIIPMIASLSEDAIYSVPKSYREGSYALGISKLVTIFSIVIPAARSGILVSLVLSLGRAVGETMIVAIAAGQRPELTLDPRVPIQTMTAYIVQVSQGDTPAGTIEYQTIFAVGATLFVMTFLMNAIIQRWKGKMFHK